MNHLLQGPYHVRQTAHRSSVRSLRVIERLERYGETRLRIELLMEDAQDGVKVRGEAEVAVDGFPSVAVPEN